MDFFPVPQNLECDIQMLLNHQRLQEDLFYIVGIAHEVHRGHSDPQTALSSILSVLDEYLY
jgi:hypothetical protein